MDWQSISAIVVPLAGLGAWIYSRLDKRFDTIESDIKELRTSLNRMEGAFYSKDCCMLKDDRQNKKVE